MVSFKSQKAKGIYHLTKKWINWFHKPKAEFYPQQVITQFPVFARPCPTMPRHGFVDSRLVKNKAELEALAKEIEATGEPVQIVCMPFISADYSGIVNLSGVTFGKGHDGATSGTSAKFIPCSASKELFQRELNFHGPDVGINDPDVAYGEFVGLFKDDKSTIKPIAIGQPHTTTAAMQATEITSLNQQGVYTTVPVKVVEGTNGVATVIAQGDVIPKEDRITSKEELMEWEKELIQEAEERDAGRSAWDYTG